VHTTEHDGGVWVFCGNAGKREGVPCVVGYVLDFGKFVVVGEDDGVAGSGESSYFCGPFFVSGDAVVEAGGIFVYVGK
jgi:hypothetical protein